MQRHEGKADRADGRDEALAALNERVEKGGALLREVSPIETEAAK
jgi:hypothetical protein